MHSHGVSIAFIDNNIIRVNFPWVEITNACYWKYKLHVAKVHMRIVLVFFVGKTNY